MSHHSILSLCLAIIACLFVIGSSSCVHETATKDCGGNTIPANWPCEAQVTACGETIYGPPFSVDTISCLYITACGETIVGEPVDTIDCSTQALCAPDTLYYERDIAPIINANCASCHTAAANLKGIVLTSYAEIINSAIIAPGDPENSILYEVITETGQRMMPPSSEPPLTNHEITMLREWIRQGGDNKSCDLEGCDTTAVSYANTIIPILNRECISCHTTGGSPGGGVVLDSYAGVVASVEDGTFFGSLLDWEGYVFMPKSNPRTPLPNCEIIQIKTWITNGYPEN